MSFRDNIRKVTPYTPGEQPKLSKVIKLNTNENPYPPSPLVEQTLQQLPAEEFRKYPDPAVSKLTKAIAARHGVQDNQVFVGVGSDDVLGMAFLTFFNGSKELLFPDVTYSFYPVWADLFRIPARKIPLAEDFTICADDYKVENGGIVLPNPNAPTGIALELAKLEEIVAANQESVVIIDEAYVDFGTESAVSLIDRYPNLLVVQTFSKSRAMAGMRIGYCIGQAELISALQSVKYAYNSYTMSQAAIELGTASICDEAYFQETCGKIVAVREWAKGEFEKLGFSGTDSKANFLFVRHKCLPAAEIFQRLRERSIFVRYFAQERIDQYLRVTIGTRQEMEELFAALREIVGEV